MKKRWIWFLLPAVALVGIGAVWGLPKPPATVETYRLVSQAWEQTVVCNGVVEAGENESVVFPFPCILREVTVHAGQQVEKDTVVAVLDKEATSDLLGGDTAALLALAATEEEIVAPAQGIAVAVKAKAGQTLEAGTPCVTVAPRSALRVRISIREKDLPRLKTGMAVHVSGDGFSRSLYSGTLTEISYTVAGGTGTTVEGLVTLAEGQADDSLRLGLTAKAAVVVNTVADGIVVPYEAVKSDSDGKDYIYVVENGVAVRRDLTVEAQLGDGLLLADTALRNATVILHPNAVTDGMTVVVEEAV